MGAAAARVGAAAARVGAVAARTLNEPLTLRWDDITIGDWKKLLAKAPDSNIVLSWPAALAALETHRKRPHFGVFYRGDIPAALVLASVKKSFLFERIAIHRGPLWLVPPTPDDEVAALRQLANAWPAKRFRRVHLMPEMPNTPESHDLLKAAGYISLEKPPYKSVFLDISQPLYNLEANFKKGWKSALSKSRKHNLTYTRDNTTPGFKLFLRGYRRDKTLKGYGGPSILFLLNMRKHARREDMLLLEAWHEGELVAGQLFVTHGQSATYFVGWTTPQGREVAAHNGLLYFATEQLQKAGIKTLDMGGLAENAPGLNKFKQGLGGRTYELAGEWTR